MFAEHLAQNLTALASAGGPAPSVGDAPHDRVRVLEAGGLPFAELRDSTGAWCRLHSARGPDREAARQIDDALAGRQLPSLVAVLGAGLGWVLDELERRSDTVRVIVLDPWPELSRLWLSRRSWRSWLESGRLTLVTGGDYAGLSRLWPMVDVGGDAPLVVSNAVLARTWPGDLREARRAFDRLVYGATENEKARRKFGPRHLAATLENLPGIVAEGGVADLDGLARGRAVVVVGAGPSLNENAAAIARARDRALIVAADTALRPLLAHGAPPHLVVSLDPSDENAEHLRNLPDCRDVWLAADSGLAAHALEPFRGRTFFFRVSDAPPSSWLQQNGISLVKLRAWGSVITAAFDLALRMGASSVLFAGLDLAYTAGRPYCRHSTFERRWARWAAIGDRLSDQWAFCTASDLPRLPDVGGGEVATSRTLVEFRDWLVEQTLGHGGVRFVNTTGHGILSGGTVIQGRLEAELANWPPGANWNLTDRWARRDRSARESLQGLRKQLAVLLKGSLPQEWREFTDHDGGALARTAAASALRALETTRLPPRCSHAVIDRPEQAAAPMPLADVAETLRSLLTGSGRLFEGGSPTASEQPRIHLAEAHRILRALLGREQRLAALGDAGTSQATVPAVVGFEWEAGARGAVETFEEHLARACLCAVRETPPTWLPWSAEAVQPVLETEGPDAAPPASTDGEADREARVALCVEYATAVAYVLAGESVTPRLARGWASVASSLRGRSALGASAVSWRVVAQASGLSLPEELACSGVRADTGSLRLCGVGERPIDPIEPEILTCRGLPKGTRVCLLGPDAALYTPWLHGCSYRIDEAGNWTALAAWPEVIDGEVPWGTDGGGLAFSARRRRLLCRASAGATPAIEGVDFTPIAVGLSADGRVWWGTMEGGVWEGVAGRTPLKALDTPPLSAVLPLESKVALIPGRYAANGEPVRCRHKEIWVMDPRSLDFRSSPTGPYGQVTGRSETGDWLAEAHPNSDLVILECARERLEFELTVYYPVAVAWAGGSLLVACGDGHVLFFRGLVARVLSGLPKARPRGTA